MASTPTARPYIGWRLLALFYDVFPALALWFVVGAIAVAANGGRPIRAGTLGSALEFVALWAVTGAYAAASWRRGGQTLGMRAWRLRVVAPHGPVTWRGAIVRYAVGTASLLLGGLGFWWAWLDRDRRTWHDRASGTHVERVAKRAGEVPRG